MILTEILSNLIYKTQYRLDEPRETEFNKIVKKTQKANSMHCISG